MKKQSLQEVEVEDVIVLNDGLQDYFLKISELRSVEKGKPPRVVTFEINSTGIGVNHMLNLMTINVFDNGTVGDQVKWIRYRKDLLNLLPDLASPAKMVTIREIRDNGYQDFTPQHIGL